LAHEYGSIFAPGRCGEDRRDGFGKIDRHADISSVPAGWTSFLFRFRLGSRYLAAGADEAACGFSDAGKIKRKGNYPGSVADLMKSTR
jgi:hypothetical protein